MKLFYHPGACSLAPHIVSAEAEIPLDLVRVDLATRRLASGEEFGSVNAKGYVPVLELDDGQQLTEGPAIMQYLADMKPDSGLAPPSGTLARARLHEALNYISTEIHKTYHGILSPSSPQGIREERIAYVKRRYRVVEDQLSERPYLLGHQFTAADAYMYVMWRPTDRVETDWSEFVNLRAFRERVEQRPAVRAALQTEGLLGSPMA